MRGKSHHPPAGRDRVPDMTHTRRERQARLPPRSIHPPLDEDTRQMAKHYFKLIQAIHHKHIMDEAIATNHPPKGMLRQVKRLTSFIKPASPTEAVQTAVSENTEVWMQNNLKIMQEHYAKIISAYDHLPPNDTAVHIALGWVKKRFKTRLTQPTLRAAEALFLPGSQDTSHGFSLTSPSPSQPSYIATPPSMLLENWTFPPLPQPQGPPLLQEPTHRGSLSSEPAALNSQSTPVVGISRASTSPGEVESHTPHPPPLPLSPVIIIHKNTHTPSVPVQAPIPSFTATPPHPPHPTPGETRGPSPASSDDFRPQQAVKHKRPNMSKHNRRKHSFKTHTHTPHTYTTPHPGSIHSDMRVVEWDPPGQTSLDADVSPSSSPTGCEAGSKHKSAPTQDEPQKRQDQVVVYDMMTRGSKMYNCTDLSVIKPQSDYTRTTSVGPVCGGASTPARSFNLPTSDRGGTPVQSPRTGATCLPNCHSERRGRRIADWSLRCKKTIWFIGDSSLSKIPAYSNTDIQVDSFPGASFYHFQQVLENTPPHPGVKLVVLSVGINNRDQDPKKTSIKQLRTLYRRAQTTFPHATITIPLINFSPLLPQAQKRNLIIINHFISTHLPFLGPLHSSHFETLADGIHWTQETTRRIFQLWITELQITA